MDRTFDGVKDSTYSIQRLMSNIEQITGTMSRTFQETILRHEQQFIKCYRVKIHELVKLIEQLKGTIQDKFINNTLAKQLETVLKQRDYFKYQCLKLNSQHQTLLDDHKNLTAQSNNASEQIVIYKHLLETEKIKSGEVEKNVDKLKKHLSEIAMRSIPETKSSQQNKTPQFEKEMVRLKRQLRQKNQVIRALRQKVQDLERIATISHGSKIEKKQMYELWRVCVEGWRRQIQLKSKKQGAKLPTVEQMTIMQKKQLLRLFFSHSQFLRFIQRLIFDNGFKVIFQSVQEQYMEKNRAKLMNYMSQRRIYTSTRGIRI